MDCEPVNAYLNPLTHELCDWIQSNYLTGYQDSDSEETVQNESPVSTAKICIESLLSPVRESDYSICNDEKTDSSLSLKKLSSDAVFSLAQPGGYSSAPVDYFTPVHCATENNCSNVFIGATNPMTSTHQLGSPQDNAHLLSKRSNANANEPNKIVKKAIKSSTVKQILKAIDAPEKEISAPEKKKLRELARGLTCMNCQTTKTPLWRRTEDKQHSLCNACGLYYKQYSCHRPIAYKARKPRWTKNSAKMAVLEKNLALVTEKVSAGVVDTDSFSHKVNVGPSVGINTTVVDSGCPSPLNSPISGNGNVSPMTAYAPSAFASPTNSLSFNNANLPPDFASFASNLGFKSGFTRVEGTSLFS